MSLYYVTRTDCQFTVANSHGVVFIPTAASQRLLNAASRPWQMLAGWSVPRPVPAGCQGDQAPPTACCCRAPGCPSHLQSAVIRSIRCESIHITGSLRLDRRALRDIADPRLSESGVDGWTLRQTLTINHRHHSNEMPSLCSFIITL